MKYSITFLLVTLSLASLGQANNPDFSNLVRLGEIYSSDINVNGVNFKSSVEELRTPGLNHIIDALIAVGEGDPKLLTKEFLSKPSERELKYWYVIREIHYNNETDALETVPNEVIAKRVLEDDIDSRWLLDNYYYRIQDGIARLFNDADLSEQNINLDELGLEDNTEKAILFLSVTKALTERFQVLKMVQNNEKLLEFASKLPTFNNKPYYEFAAFDFDDFDWIGAIKTESYKARHLGSLYAVLDAHFAALAEKEKTTEMRKLYFNSILFIPDYFKYAGDSEKELKRLYKKSKE